VFKGRYEIARSVAPPGVTPPTKPDALLAFLAKHAPPVYDPFCGGGSIPLEAQRLGLEAHASDLNPVPVLITKALIEIPPRFVGKPPVNPESRKKSSASGIQATGGRYLVAVAQRLGRHLPAQHAHFTSRFDALKPPKIA
jgi:putative DNA methylase